MRAGVLLLALALAPRAWAQECIDPDTPDCDGDGFAAADDCDDDNPDVNPDAAEICNSQVDEDCDDVVDDDCYEAFQEGTLEGGTTCEGAQSGWAVLLFVPPFALRRRRR